MSHNDLKEGREKRKSIDLGKSENHIHSPPQNHGLNTHQKFSMS